MNAAPLGILGGTFDPIHFAHLRLAETARETLRLERVRLVPAGQPPHREQPGSSAAHRLAMTRLAVRDNPALEVDDAEVRAAQKSYTVTTLERLRAEWGAQRPLVLILGSDAFAGLPDWHRWSELFDLAHLAVAVRHGYGEADAAEYPAELERLRRERISHDSVDLRAPAGRLFQIRMEPLAISASLIRQLIALRHSPRYLLPQSVLDYIALHDLYR